MKTFKVVKRRTEVFVKEIEAENELVALRIFRDDTPITDRHYEDDSTLIQEVANG